LQIRSRDRIKTAVERSDGNGATDDGFSATHICLVFSTLR
jgi:hypothetical protein